MAKVLTMPSEKRAVYRPACEYSANNSGQKRRVLPTQKAGEDQLGPSVTYLSNGRRLPSGADAYNSTDFAEMQYGG